ncbi:MAG: VOC family protein [Pseudomonadota bacterium]
MANAWLEHCNLTVSDLDKTINFFLAVFPEFSLRHKGVLEDALPDGGVQKTPWAHVGTDESYLALQAPPIGHEFKQNKNNYFNHMGFVVDDIDETLERVKDAGCSNLRTDYSHPHRLRAYAWVFDGTVLEFVQYKSENAEERNCYAQ